MTGVETAFGFGDTPSNSPFRPTAAKGRARNNFRQRSLTLPFAREARKGEPEGDFQQPSLAQIPARASIRLRSAGRNGASPLPASPFNRNAGKEEPKRTSSPVPSPQSPLPNQTGVTLIELVVAIVVIGIALGGILMLLNRSIATSADPMIQQQAISIGEAYIEEIVGKAYERTSPNCGDRKKYNAISCYNGLSDTGAHDQLGNAIPGLGNYDVNVSVTSTKLNSANAKLVTVTVSHPGVADIVLATYRLDLSS